MWFCSIRGEQPIRQWTGHVYASTEVPRKALTFNNKNGLKWFQSSPKVRRGFCVDCGSSIFFNPLDQVKHEWIAIALGCFTSVNLVKIKQHIFTAEKGDYYEINDNAKQKKSIEQAVIHGRMKHQDIND